MQRFVAYLVVMAAAFGAAGILVGATYRSLVGRWASRSMSRLPIALGAAAFLVPGALFPLAIWPTLERAAPRLVYRYASDAAQVAIRRRIALSVRVGDSGADVADRIPGGPWPRMRTGTATVEGSGWRIEIVEGRVVRVEAVDGDTRAVR